MEETEVSSAAQPLDILRPLAFETNLKQQKLGIDVFYCTYFNRSDAFILGIYITQDRDRCRPAGTPSTRVPLALPQRLPSSIRARVKALEERDAYPYRVLVLLTY